MRSIAGIDLISTQASHLTAILAFQHLLEKHNLGEQIFETVKAHLRQRGMPMRQGTIVDATLIAAPSSAKNSKGEWDPEMHQTKKGIQWHFGMKVYIGVDKDSGLIHSVVTTAAKVHDLSPAADLLHGKEEVVYTDAGSQGIHKRLEMKGRKSQFSVALRPGKRRALPDSPEGRLVNLVESAKAHIRATGEHPSGDQESVGLPEDSAVGDAQKQLQGECVGCSHVSSPRPPLVAGSHVIGKSCALMGSSTQRKITYSTSKTHLSTAPP